jgi:2',3'-cyclic-nucleotide 2'-phosphodiesterase (5'-nucleotidase family)
VVELLHIIHLQQLNGTRQTRSKTGHAELPHQEGNGSRWTRKYKPIEIESVYKNVSSFEEDKITKELDSVLAYCPETMDKSKGKWQTTIGNLLATAVFEFGNPVFEKRTQKTIDICLLNSGGIRAIIPQGNVSTRTAFEVMPFENSLYVVALKGTQIRAMGTYLMTEKKAHPIYGIQFFADKNDFTVKRILVNGQPLEDEKTYYVATSDYLANGGDNMTFFQESTEKYDLDYKIRNVLIDYFKKVDTLPVLKDEKIILE